MSLMGRTERLWYQHLDELADQRGPVETEHCFRLLIDKPDYAPPVHPHHRIGENVKHTPEVIPVFRQGSALRGLGTQRRHPNPFGTATENWTMREVPAKARKSRPRHAESVKTKDNLRHMTTSAES
jgi:hypothetical protein